MNTLKLSVVGKRPTEDEVKNFNPLKKEIKKIGLNVDPYFIQEISDRLFGPDSEEYRKELDALHKRFRGREGKFGNQFYEGVQ